MWAPTSAYAATLVGAGGVMDIDFNWFTLALMFGLSTLSGGTALVWRIDLELRKAPDGKLPNPRLFAASNMMGSWTAGALAWVTSQGQELGVFPTLGAVILMSFGGARALELAAEKYLARTHFTTKEPEQ